MKPIYGLVQPNLKKLYDSRKYCKKNLRLYIAKGRENKTMFDFFQFIIEKTDFYNSLLIFKTTQIIAE